MLTLHVEHVGVKAPGKEKRITFLLEKKSDVVFDTHLNGLSPPIESSLTRILKVTSGNFLFIISKPFLKLF